jgi:hypothetical protein
VRIEGDEIQVGLPPEEGSSAASSNELPDAH